MHKDIPKGHAHTHLYSSICRHVFRSLQIIADMETQVHKLREELINVNSQRKQQLVELGLLREEEKQRAARDHETTVNKLRAESERVKMELKKTHAAETEMTLEKFVYRNITDFTEQIC
ncbi:hypothetical protein STEG23_021685 [Scotinomys teguina]